MRPSLQLSASLAALAVLGTAACGDLGDGSQNENEVITTVLLRFAPMGGGAALDAAFDDADGDGGDPPRIDPIDLAAGTTYTLTVRFQNKLEDPPEEITDEVADEGAEHQLFFTGTAVDGPAAAHPGAPLQHSYADADFLGLPIGLSSTIAASPGTGTLTVTLRHVPALDGAPVKTSDLAERVKAGGTGAIGGETDAEVSFAVTVR
ncbi:MAG TPA: hypothetical protein VNO30_14960 [Kofleriaceae bacterium]|nr:hypothetical protein [Kofleriaceae bacterium]